MTDYGVTAEQARELVIQALADPRWDFRTVKGISRDTGLSQERVADTLMELKDQIRQPSVRTRTSEPVFTLRSRGVKLQEKLAALQQMVGF